MKPNLTLILSAITLSAAATYAVASNDNFRNWSERDQWLPKQQIVAQLNQMGYRVHRLNVDDGCLEAYVTDGNGVPTELYVDPATGMPGGSGRYSDCDY